MPPKYTRARTVAEGASPAAPPTSTVGRRVTHLRLRELGQETAAAGDVASDKPGLSWKKRKVQGKEGGDKAAAGAGGGGAADPPALLSRVIPSYPRSGDSGDVLRWIKECRRIYQLPDPEDTVIPFTCRTEPNDPQTAIDVESTPDKHMIRRAARSVVGVVSTKPDGKGIALCTGIVVGWNEATKSATIVTSSATVCYRGALIHPKPKLLVHLPTRTVVEGRLLFFNAHYRIALLEVFSDSPLQPANLGSSMEFGEEVFALARDDESSLSVRRGTVLWHEPPECLKYMYCLSLSCEVARGGTGGPVIDQHGDVVGMAFHCLPNPDILSASILQTCIRMWTEFSRIARPDLGVELRAFELLDVSHQEEIELEHSVRDGFIVSVDYDGSTAARLGISRGDMIVSYNGRSDFTLHKFEDFLLSIGWGLLASVGSSWNVDLELEVYNPVRRTTRSITYPLEFSDAFERVLAFTSVRYYGRKDSVKQSDQLLLRHMLGFFWLW